MSLGGSDKSKRWRKQNWRFWDTARQSIEYCGEKIIYHSPAEAQKMVDVQAGKWEKHLRVYECPHAAHWHLTSKAQW